MLNKLKSIIDLDNPLRLYYHKLRAILAINLYGNPSKDMIIIGVTGTNGKTTCCNIIAKGLRKAGKKVFMFSTVNIIINNIELVNNTKMTSPDVFYLQKMLKKAKENNCEYAIIETASHGIKMHRVWGIQYDIAVLTNISRDHLDLHKTMDDYVNTKLLLFKNLIGFDRKKGVKKCFVINNNSKYSDLFLSETSDICYTYGQGSTVDLKATNIKYYQNKTIFDIKIAGSNIHIDTSLIGNFNVSNILASVGVLLSLGIKSDIISKAINSIETIPGRFETIDNILGINIIVDYAHTPDALEKVLLTIKNLNKVGEIITVFGATGDRDKTKRPIMGEIVSKYSDKIILTQDDDYTENRDQIIKEVEKGITLEKNKDFFIIPDRYKAIKASIILAKKNDFLLIAGKGDEHILVTNSGPIKWHDKSIIEKIINNINNTK